jgi:hypothetical protein
VKLQARGVDIRFGGAAAYADDSETLAIRDPIGPKEALIFEAQRLMLRDPLFLKSARLIVAGRPDAVASAVLRACEVGQLTPVSRTHPGPWGSRPCYQSGVGAEGNTPRVPLLPGLAMGQPLRRSQRRLVHHQRRAKSTIRGEVVKCDTVISPPAAMRWGCASSTIGCPGCTLRRRF